MRYLVSALMLRFDARPLLPDLLHRSTAEVHRSPEGTLYLWQPSPGLVITRIEGFFTKTAERAVDVAWRRTASTTRLSSFNDWEAMTDYDSSTRVRLTAVGMELRPRFEACHVLTRATTVLIGVRMASLAAPVIRAHTSREDFEAALREAMRK